MSEDRALLLATSLIRLIDDYGRRMDAARKAGNEAEASNILRARNEEIYRICAMELPR